jgi:hypothetical protein
VWDQCFNPKLPYNQANYMTKRVTLGGPVFDTDDDGNYIMDKNGICARLACGSMGGTVIKTSN